jgi:DNA-binding winged helix-turn-helix (wHTH) protein/predicted ATPase
MSDQPERIYVFWPYQLEPVAYRLLRDGQPVHLRPKTFNTLLVLVEKRGQLVGKEELVDKVWPGEATTDDVIYHPIKELRKELGKRPDGGEYIETVPRKGYRFTAEVEEVAPPPTRPSPPRRPATKDARRYLVGREKELADLTHTFESVADGGCYIVCVTGEPGIGKTTLTEHFLRELSAGGGLCYTAKGNCSERLVGTGAYLPFFDILESLTLAAGVEDIAREMQQLAPSWYAQVTPVARGARPAATPESDDRLAPRERLKREVRGFLQKISSRRPLVFLLEDMQWADNSTVDLLAYLATKSESIRALVVLTYRPTETQISHHPFLRLQKDLQARGLCHELSLSFWSREDIENYFEHAFPGHKFSADFLSLIHHKTEGSPLFVVDLMRYLREQNGLVEDQGHWRLAEPTTAIAGRLPASILSMIDRKIEQLDEVERRVLDVACVQGYAFDAAVVSQVLGLGVEEVERRLHALEHVHAFVRFNKEHDFPSGQFTQRYQFVHLLYQNTLYAMLRPTRRATLSAAVAQALLGYYGDKHAAVAPELTLLFETARAFGQAFHYFGVAAHNAVKVSAYGEAYAIAKSGLKIKDSVREGPERDEDELALLNTLGMSVMATRGFAAPELKDIYERSVEICERSGDSKRLPIALYGLWVFHIDGGRLETARRLGEQILESARRHDDAVVLVEGLYALGTTLLQLGEFRDAYRHLNHAVANYDRERHAANRFFYQLDPGVSCSSSSARALWFLGLPDQALRRSKDALELARSLNHPESYAYALTFVGDIYHFLGEMAETDAHIDRAIQCSVEQGLTQELSWARMMKGWVLVEQGRTEEGVAELQHHLAHYRELGSEVARSKFLGLLARALGRAGKVWDGLRVLEEAFEFVRTRGERYYEAELYRIKGELLVTLHASEQAARANPEDLFVKAIELARRQGAKSLELRGVTSLARLYRTQHRASEARARLNEIYSWFTEGFDTADLIEAKSTLAELE